MVGSSLSTWLRRGVLSTTLLFRCAWGLSLAQIEVERKFVAPSALELQSKVATLGGKLLGESTIVDRYYDTKACDLSRRDIWLRKRGGTWELKVPPKEAPAARSGGERTNFEEVIGGPAACARLAAELPVLFKSDYDIETVLLRAECAVFAEFETTRTTFQLGECLVDLDVASFGHSVMEIEQIVTTVDEIPAAHDAIEAVARDLDAVPFQGNSGGKLEVYIRKFCPQVLAILTEYGILSSSEE